MRKGGSYHVRIPPELGYGAQSPPGIPANSELDFDIHVVDVARAQRRWRPRLRRAEAPEHSARASNFPLFRLGVSRAER